MNIHLTKRGVAATESIADRLLAERYTPGSLPPAPQPTTPLVDEQPPVYGECATCGMNRPLTMAGRVRRHGQLRVNGTGPYESDERCPGSGELPELVEERFGPGGRT